MNVIDVYPENRSKLPQFIIIVLLLFITALLGVMAWMGWMLWQIPDTVEPVELAKQSVARIDIGGGMQVVAVQFNEVTQVQQAVLISVDDEVYETVTAIDEPVDNLGFLVPEDLKVKEIQITPAEGAAFVYDENGGEKK